MVMRESALFAMSFLWQVIMGNRKGLPLRLDDVCALVTWFLLWLGRQRVTAGGGREFAQPNPIISSAERAR